MKAKHEHAGYLISNKLLLCLSVWIFLLQINCFFFNSQIRVRSDCYGITQEGILVSCCQKVYIRCDQSILSSYVCMVASLRSSMMVN